MLDYVDNAYFAAFQYLSLSRTQGMGVTGISLESYIHYHTIFIHPHEIDKFCNIMRCIDGQMINEASKDK